eukprot:scaffold3282_cov101-Isochrysis_galbana.AAC.7
MSSAGAGAWRGRGLLGGVRRVGVSLPTGIVLGGEARCGDASRLGIGVILGLGCGRFVGLVPFEDFDEIEPAQLVIIRPRALFIRGLAV